MGQLAPMSKVLYNLKVLNGKDKGAVYQINSNKIIIGRDPSCDIIVKDDSKCSRQHIEIECMGSRFKVTNISYKSKVYVNKQDINEAQLLHNANIQIGDTVFKFSLATPGLSPVSNPPYQPPPAAIGHHNNVKRSHGYNEKPKRNLKVYIVFAVILLGFIWLISDDSGKNKKPVDIVTEQDIYKSIDKVKEQVKKTQEEKRLSGKDSQEFKLAQAYYLKGFRDYKKGQYERAIKHFNGCLGIFTNHTECNRYILLARKKQDELIQYHIYLGRQYKDQNQFSACKSAFRNVMYMIKNAQDPRYNEAKTNYAFCQENLEGKL